MIGDNETNQMKQTIILSLCFLPLGIVFVIMKLSVLLSQSISEVNYIEKDAIRPHGPYVGNPYDDVDEKEEEYGNRTDYR